MGKYASRLLFITTIMMISIFISMPVFGAEWQNCSPEGKPYTCFTTASGYRFQIVDSEAQGACDNPGGGSRLVSSFPEFIEKGYDGNLDGNLWCYSVTAPAKGTTSSSVSQINLQVALPYFNPSIIKMAGGQPFNFNLSNGCLGDSTTGFEVGDLEACGVKWTYRVNPGSSPQRFSFLTAVTPDTHDLGKGPVIMAAKVGSSVEPGFILGPDRSSAYSTIGMPNSVCQVISGLPYYFKKDDVGCTESVYVCHGTNTNCEGTFDDVHEYPKNYDLWTNTEADLNTCFKLQDNTIKMTMKRLDTGADITSVPKTLREVGFVGGNNACREGIITGKFGSPPCTATISAGGRTYRTTYYSSPPCPR